MKYKFIKGKQVLCVTPNETFKVRLEVSPIKLYIVGIKWVKRRVKRGVKRQ